MGISASAGAEEIKAAFRKQAKELHPDTNSNVNAKSSFQKLNEAYECLSDSSARAQYDSSGYSNEQTPGPEKKPPEPAVCSKCNSVTAQPRYRVFESVISFILATTKKPIQGIFCATCARKVALEASLVSAVLGWWGVPWGPIYTVGSILRNANGGYEPPGSRDVLLWNNALAFLFRKNYRLAYGLASQVQLSRDEEIATKSQKLMEILDSNGENNYAPLSNPWSQSQQWKWLHFVALSAIPLLLFGTIYFNSDSSQTGNGDPWVVMSAPPASSGQEEANIAIAKCATPPQNGAALEEDWSSAPRSKYGSSLKISNGSSGNAVIKIRDASTGYSLATFFVASNSTATYDRIPDGGYRIQYAFGTELAEDCRTFASMTGAGEFPGVRNFSTRIEGSEIISQELSFTLYTVPGGNVRPTAIDAAAFNAP